MSPPTTRRILLDGPGWPRHLGALRDPPAELWVRGDAALPDSRAIAIVGTRECSPEGRDWTHRAAARLAEDGLVVVSGLARGIDAAAHRGALEAGGDTVAVLGCGVDIAYPPENADLQERIAARGTLVSEHPPGTCPRPWSFPRRNRIIAALADAIVVVEARVRSGALITARLGLEMGREVFVVPGFPDSPLSAGPLALLRDGARAVRSAEDVLEDLGGISGEPLPAPEHVAALNAVQEGAAGPADLARALALDPEEARERWATLELLGRVKTAPRSS